MENKIEDFKPKHDEDIDLSDFPEFGGLPLSEWHHGMSDRHKAIIEKAKLKAKKA
jgi:hypothetical protein